MAQDSSTWGETLVWALEFPFAGHVPDPSGRCDECYARGGTALFLLLGIALAILVVGGAYTAFRAYAVHYWPAWRASAMKDDARALIVHYLGQGDRATDPAVDRLVGEMVGRLASLPRYNSAVTSTSELAKMLEHPHAACYAHKHGE